LQGEKKVVVGKASTSGRSLTRKFGEQNLVNKEKKVG
jgi:hypothetical protein